MARIQIDETTLGVRFNWAEKVFGLVRDLAVPRSAVREVQMLGNGWTAVRGWRVGTCVPGIVRVGVWRSAGRRQLVAVRPARPTLQVRLTGQKFDELLISDNHAADHAWLLTRPPYGTGSPPP
ncbi:hypothetical protein ACFYSW_29875 [Rhodococcus aetherivorans]|uniref:hypothetical protein n=1 Tax=Rhodococcus aetherivorans TaxID=191292 RepID=UPI0036C39719